MEDFLTLNTLAWVAVAFFAVGWTLRVVTQKQYATKNNIMIVTWWRISIGAIIFLKLSPFFLFGLMPVAMLLSLIVPGLIGIIILLMLSFSSQCMRCCINNNNNNKKLKKNILKELNNGLIKECSICLDKISVDNNIVVLSCKHFYHKECISEWFKKSKTCPLCRIEL